MPAIHTPAGLLVREARLDRGWTHQQMAVEIIRNPQLGPAYNISTRTIANVEAGRVKRPYVRAAFAIATVLDKHVSDLWPVNA